MYHFLHFSLLKHSLVRTTLSMTLRISSALFYILQQFSALSIPFTFCYILLNFTSLHFFYILLYSFALRIFCTFYYLPYRLYIFLCTSFLFIFFYITFPLFHKLSLVLFRYSCLTKDQRLACTMYLVVCH